MLSKKGINLTLLIFGHLCLVLGVIGVFLPILPTTPFLLLATFLYSKSSPRLHQYILNHKIFGPPVRDWEERKVISTKAKFLAIGMILFTLYFKILGLKINIIVKTIVIIILISLVIFIGTRKSK